MRSSAGTANCGVPMKIRRNRLPLARFLQLADLAFDQVALQHADARNVEAAVQVVGFVNEGPRQHALAGLLEPFALRVLGTDGYLFRTGDILAKTGQAEAAFLAVLDSVAADNLRIDEHQLLVLVMAGRGIDDGDAFGNADLRCRQPHSARRVHGFEHVRDELVQLRRVEFSKDGGFSFQDRIAIFDDVVCHQKFLTCSMYPSKLRLVSSIESPPNFSRKACASTIATIASPITPAAGTTQTSLRS